MQKQIYEKFADAILKLEPDLQMTKDEIMTVVKFHGLEHFCRKLCDDAKEFIEIIELINRLESKNGDNNE